MSGGVSFCVASGGENFVFDFPHLWMAESVPGSALRRDWWKFLLLRKQKWRLWLRVAFMHGFVQVVAFLSYPLSYSMFPVLPKATQFLSKRVNTRCFFIKMWVKIAISSILPPYFHFLFEVDPSILQNGIWGKYEVAFLTFNRGISYMFLFIYCLLL